MLTSNIYDSLRNLHRRMRKKIKSTLKPEIPQRKIRSFIKQQKNNSFPRNFPEATKSIAIVIPCFGHSSYLEEMFNSIKNQTRQPDEVIFVVDASPDSSFQILENLISQFQSHSKIKFALIRNEENIGQAASLNKGIEISQSDLIMILNDDDYLLHDSIETALFLLQEYPQAALLGGHSLHFCGNELYTLPKFISNICPVRDIEIDLRLPEHVLAYKGYNDLNMTHSGSTFYKAAWQSIGGYYPDKSKRVVHFSDRDFQLRMNAVFPVALSNITPLSCWRNDSSVDQGINS